MSETPELRRRREQAAQQESAPAAQGAHLGGIRAR